MICIITANQKASHGRPVAASALVALSFADTTSANQIKFELIYPAAIGIIHGLLGAAVTRHHKLMQRPIRS